MAYSELIKDISHIREYMREFFVYGFKSRGEIGSKSARSYDNERRRIESWLCDYMSFRQDANGKSVFISVDSRHVPRNPLYRAWKAKSFTKNDITLHFLLMDILSPDTCMSFTDIVETIDRYYISFFENFVDPIDDSTLRNKLKEYVNLGLVTVGKRGNRYVYALSEDKIYLQSWTDAICFFSEVDPLGVIGSFLQDKFETLTDFFSFKHNYLLFAPDSGVMLDILTAITERRRVEVDSVNPRSGEKLRQTLLPLKVFVSTHGGRQYAACCDTGTERFAFLRLDSIRKLKLLEIQKDYETYALLFSKYRKHLWGVATGQDASIERIEMTVRIEANEKYLIRRLEREKRCGVAERLSEDLWLFVAEVYDALELLPWIRTFIGRIAAFHCTNKSVEELFQSDLEAMGEIYADDAF
jgi:DNA-binding transcriptional ArsR family regulator